MSQNPPQAHLFYVKVFFRGALLPAGKPIHPPCVPRAAVGGIFPGGLQLVNRTAVRCRGASVRSERTDTRCLQYGREKMVVQMIVAECDSHVIFDESVRKRGREIRGSAQRTFRVGTCPLGFRTCSHLLQPLDGRAYLLTDLRAVGARALITELREVAQVTSTVIAPFLDTPTPTFAL